MAAGPFNAERIVEAVGTHPFGHHLLERNVDVAVDETVDEAGLHRQVRIARHQEDRGGLGSSQIVDDDARLRDCLASRVVTQDGELG